MNNEELQILVQCISEQYFHKPFCHRAVFNPRLRTTGGRYLLQSHCLEFNPKQFDFFGREALIRIIKHELCHYHLHLSGRGYRHCDSSFKRLLSAVGGTRFCQCIPGSENRSIARYNYSCSSCGAAYQRRRRINTERYVCGRCGGNLVRNDGRVPLS
ncbi:MAG: SprT family protein [Sporolactobacillus sp.]